MKLSYLKFINSHFSASHIIYKQNWRLFYSNNMPKDRPPSLSRLREMRIKEKQNKPATIPSEIYLSVLGNGSISSPRALYMFTDQRRYLFNCGEGTQRLAHEYKMKMSKLDHIFITHKSWENLGGLLGLSLTLQDIGVPEMSLHGPPEVERIYEFADLFVLTKELKVAKQDNMDQPFVDSCMEVNYISINAVSKTNNGDMDEHCDKKQRLEVESADTTIAYACKCHNKPGHLMIEKCLEQGVAPGPLLGDLKNGKDVTLPSGKIVLSKDVVSEEQIGPVFLVVECPSENFLKNFASEKKFEKYQTDDTNAASLVVHFTPSNILKCSIYQEWMKKFPLHTQHLILNEDNSTLNSTAMHRIQHKLNLLHPKIFDLLHEEEAKLSAMDSNAIQADTLNRFYLRPHKGLDRSFNVVADQTINVQEAMATKDFPQSLEQLKKNIEKFSQRITPDAEYPEVIFLGTGSSLPSKIRNVSSILLNLSNNQSILMDCGEGSLSQILRLYGSERTNNLLRQLSCVFISHMHADHHLGLIQLFKSRQVILKNCESSSKPILIIAPKKLNIWLKNYQKTVETVLPSYKFIDCSSLAYSIKTSPEKSETFVEEFLEDIHISTVPVVHCPDSHALILTSKLQNWKLVYSGDAIPCEELVIAGNNCDLLIHEATMEDELADEAALKKHSTTSEAIKMGEKMNSKFTILTHFSQRYAKIPVFSEDYCNNVGCAFDNMRVRFCDLPILPLFISTLKCLFADEVEELQTKSEKRRLKQKLLKSISTNT